MDARDNAGSTPLIAAAALESPEVVKLLLAHGADVNARDEGGTTALMTAVTRNRTETVKLLTEHGAKLNAQDGLGETALHRAAQAGNAAMLALLLELGADPGIRDASDCTPLDAAEALWKTDVVQLLRSSRARAREQAAGQPTGTMITIQVRLPDWLLEQAGKLADHDQMPLDRFVTLAVMERVSSLRGSRFATLKSQLGGDKA